MSKYLIKGHTRLVSNREFKKAALAYFGKGIVSQIWTIREKFFVLVRVFNEHPMTFTYNRLTENIDICNGYKVCSNGGEVLYNSNK